MKYTLIFSPMEGDEKGFDFTVVDRVSFGTYNRLQEKGFPIDELKENTILVAVYPNGTFKSVRSLCRSRKPTHGFTKLRG